MTLKLAPWINGRQHDYKAYTFIWDAILKGKDPWLGEQFNPYGASFSLFAYLFKYNYFAPQIFGSLTFLLSGFLFTSTVNNLKNKFYLSLIWCLSPYFLLHSIAFGLVEQVMCSFIILSLYFHEKRKGFLSGVMLGFSIMFKFYSIIFIPLFWIKPKTKPKTSTLGLCFVIFFIHLFFIYNWGFSFIEALKDASTRGVDGLSLVKSIMISGILLTPWISSHLYLNNILFFTAAIPFVTLVLYYLQRKEKKIFSAHFF